MYIFVLWGFLLISEIKLIKYNKIHTRTTTLHIVL